ncbi:glycoside hydrolase family 36 N-terminal domain-containing protein [Varibaculum vaginae]|uniref:glycoside hydrolase family 36 N-terminal domain-containing protein n=1 Tax=Varibaculum vaginae TaxID=2364797 RepID=UPI001F1C8652|nr:glycoside hydrolase family 36 N-terminal domain-containing protein [Varibaculum vaginae]
MANFSRLIHLRNGGTSLCLRITEQGVPQVIYWGADLGYLSSKQCEEISKSQYSALVSGTSDVTPLFSLVPQQSEGWIGTPGLIGSRRSVALFSAFVPVDIHTDGQGTNGAPSEVKVTLHDAEADINLSVLVEVASSGVVRGQAKVTNTGSDGYEVQSLLLAMPTPASETYVLDQTGHHLRERDINTHEFTIGSHQRETSVARGHTTSSIHGTCQPGTSWQSGLVHYMHVAWSGNTRTIAEKDTQGYQGILAGELLLPGEVVLKHGEEYCSPWIIGTWGMALMMRQHVCMALFAIELPIQLLNVPLLSTPGKLFILTNHCQGC